MSKQDDYAAMILEATPTIEELSSVSGIPEDHPGWAMLAEAMQRTDKVGSHNKVKATGLGCPYCGRPCHYCNQL